MASFEFSPRETVILRAVLEHALEMGRVTSHDEELGIGDPDAQDPDAEQDRLDQEILDLLHRF
jgi:hypothetical protein